MLVSKVSVLGSVDCRHITADTESYPLQCAHLSDMWLSTGWLSRRSFAPLKKSRRLEKSPLLCVNRAAIRYGFHAGAKGIRYSVNVTSMNVLFNVLCFGKWWNSRYRRDRFFAVRSSSFLIGIHGSTSSILWCQTTVTNKFASLFKLTFITLMMAVNMFAINVIIFVVTITMKSTFTIIIIHNEPHRLSNQKNLGHPAETGD